MMLCEVCTGRGFLEYEAGLIQLQCHVCKGKGTIDGNPIRVELQSEDTGEPKVKIKHKRGRLAKRKYTKSHEKVTVEN